MKVAIIDPSAWTYYYDCILVRELTKHCYIELLTERFEYDKEFTFISPNIKFKFFELSNRISGKVKLRKVFLIPKGIEYLKNLASIYFYIKRQKFNLIHIQWCLLPLIDIFFIKLVKMTLKIPIVYTAHNILPHEIKFYDKFFFSKIYNMVDVIIVHSNNIATELKNLFGIRSDKIYVIELPIFDDYHIENLSREDARGLLNIKLNEKVILFFGLIRDYKGLDILLDATKLVKEMGLNVTLIIAGKCDNFEKYENKIRENSMDKNVIKFIHFIPSSLVEKVFCADDVLILPYKKTYGSAVLLTGIAFNKPAIVTDTGHLPEVITDGKHGFVIPPNDSEKLAEAIYKFFNLSSGEREKMEQEVNKLKESFLPDVIAKKTFEVYKNVLQKVPSLLGQPKNLISMKIIISHDIDHLSVREHIFKDLIIPKYIFWSFLELIKRKISLKIFFRKLTELFKKNAWNNLEELLNFDKKMGINPTFFIAINNGKGLSYSQKQAKQAIELIKKYNFDIGAHGICYDNYEGIKKEYEDFKKISGLEKFGFRMHYLRLNQDIFKSIARAGYLFDTTILSENLTQQHKIDNLIEIPFHIMDGNLLGPKINYTLDEVKQKTLDVLNRAEKENKKYVAILFHLRSFGDDFFHYKNWYIWLINYCKEKKYEFINYRTLL